METDLLSNTGMDFILAIAGVGLALLLFAMIIFFSRRRANIAFIRGGRNREPRLAVLDAAAIDTKRRIVLIRRDNVEHLVMIGGPTDVVIESRILKGEPVVPAKDALKDRQDGPKPSARTRYNVKRPAPNRSGQRPP